MPSVAPEQKMEEKGENSKSPEDTKHYSFVHIRAASFEVRKLPKSSERYTLNRLYFVVWKGRHHECGWEPESNFRDDFQKSKNDFKQKLIDLGVCAVHWCDPKKEVMIVVVAGETALIATIKTLTFQVSRLLFAEKTNVTATLTEDQLADLHSPTAQPNDNEKERDEIFKNLGKFLWSKALKREIERVAMKSYLRYIESDSQLADAQLEAKEEVVITEMNAEVLEKFQKIATKELNRKHAKQPFVSTKEKLSDILKTDKVVCQLAYCDAFLEMMMAYQKPLKGECWLLKLYQMHQSHLDDETDVNTTRPLKELIFKPMYLPAVEERHTKGMLLDALLNRCQICNWLFNALLAIDGPKLNNEEVWLGKELPKGDATTNGTVVSSSSKSSSSHPQSRKRGHSGHKEEEEEAVAGASVE